jgi:hypothetical protein
MTSFIKKRLQVFVSSTYTDLIQERQAAVQAILTAGHIPAGMELFTSGDESQMEVIKQWIDESDIYLLILGGRYGSVEPHSSKSYTHLEYEYATKKGKPLFSCVISDKSLNNRRSKPELIETDYGAKLKEFRAHVLAKTSKFWDDEKDIKIVVGETLSVFSRDENLIGWIRSGEEANIPAITDELARLSRENADLRDIINRQSAIEEKFNGLSFEDLKAILEKDKLLRFLQGSRLNLINGITISEIPPPENAKPTTDRLLSLGLLETTGFIRTATNLPVLKLTSVGISFLNKLEALNDHLS